MQLEQHNISALSTYHIQALTMQQVNRRLNILLKHTLNDLAIAAEIVERKVHVATREIKTQQSCSEND